MNLPQSLPITNRFIEILVIQLGSRSELIQSLIAIQLIKKFYPELAVSILIQGKYIKIVQRISWIHKVIALPEKILKKLCFSDSLKILEQWILPYLKNIWDFLINWTYSESSSYLATLLPARVKIGYTRKKDFSFLINDEWSYYIKNVIQKNIQQNIHLIDIFFTQLLRALQIHVGAPMDHLPPTENSFHFFFNHKELEILNHLPPSKKWISLQINLENAPSVLKLEDWAKLTHYLLENHPDYSIVLLGHFKDPLISQNYMKTLQSLTPLSHQVINLLGKNNFDLWAFFIYCSQWLISNDPTALHLASLLNTQVLSFLPMKFKAVPYGDGHYIIETKKTSISPEIIYGTWAYVEAKKAYTWKVSLKAYFSQLGWEKQLDSYRIYYSKMRPVAQGGGLTYQPLLVQPLSFTSWSSRVISDLAKAWYTGYTPLKNELLAGEVHPELIQNLQSLEKCLLQLHQICQQAIDIATKLDQKSTQILSFHIMKIEDQYEIDIWIRHLKKLEKKIHQLFEHFPTLNVFYQLLKIKMEFHSEHRPEFGKEVLKAYQHMRHGIQVYQTWIQNTVQLTQPCFVEKIHHLNFLYH